jgi:hypothetical protein
MKDVIINCANCDSTGWVCEDHRSKPWHGPRACGCGGAGVPCPKCNVANADNPPRLPADFETLADAIRDRTGEDFEKFARRQRLIDKMKK